MQTVRSPSIPDRQAFLIAKWGPTTFYLNAGDMPNKATCARLVQWGIEIEPAPLVGLTGDGDTLSEGLIDGRTVTIDNLCLALCSRLHSPLAERLGSALDEGAFGPVIRTNAIKLITVPDVG